MKSSLTMLMKTVSLGIALAALLFINQGVARADNVTFSTHGEFTGNFSGGTNSVFFGSGADTLVLTFNGVDPSTVNANPLTFASFGTITTTATGNGATIDPSTMLTIYIYQSSPSNGSGFVAGMLTGTISQNSSTGQILFSVSSVTIDNITYSIANNSLALVPPSTNNGNTTVQGQVAAAPVPEPATLLLLGTGLTGIAGKIRKRRRGLKKD